MEISKKITNDSRNVIKIEEVDRKQEPKIPMKRPKQLVVTKLRKGKTKTVRYIKAKVAKA